MQSKMAPKKNILMLIADDLGREQLGCYRNPALPTPNLDKLASSGTQFDMAFTSTASCSGSRTVINTGLHTHQSGSYGLTHGANGFQTFADVETAPEVFNKMGYKTGIIGKVHVSPESLYPWQVQNESESRNVAWAAEQVNDFLADARSEDKSFYLTVGFVDPHRQLQRRAGFGNVEGNYDGRLTDHIFEPEDVIVPSYLSDLPEVRRELAEYYRAIHRLDQGVGLILDCLEQQDLTRDTLVLFLSDNGPPFINSKTTLFDAGVRLPFLMRLPGNSGGIVNPNLVSYVDILPTFLDWAGKTSLQAPPDKRQRSGRSILPIVGCEDTKPGWDCVFGSHTFHEITNYWPTRYMRTRKFKYHRNVCWKLDFPFAMDLYASISFEGMRNSGTSESPAMIGPRKLKDYLRRPPEELYDMEEDPQEVNNLAGMAEFETTLKEMRDRLEAWQKQTKDLWLWRDGAPVMRYLAFNYAREGLCMPDRFDFDADSPRTDSVTAYKLI